MGLEDQLIFPEIDYSRVSQSRGMNITFVTTSRNDQGARRLLELLGLPFRRN
jgi:large subunit ribosomal protein L5